VQELQDRNLLRQNELDELEQQIAEHERELREVHKREKECELELEHFQRQKGMVTNEREFTAVISEIDFATKALTEAKARRQELETAIAQIGEEISSRRESRPEEEAAEKEVVSGWEARKEELKKRVHDLATEAAEVEAGLQPAHRSRFLRLLESKHGAALAAVVDGSCSVCHFSLRPHLQQRVRRGEEIIACETCHRILYLVDSEDAE
jgi:predicted  nucleic acid-binding Zn-ribbon protein